MKKVRWRGLLPTAFAAGALLLWGSLTATSASEAEESHVAEISAVVPAGPDRVVEIRALVDTRVADPEAVIAELAPNRIPEAEVTAAYGLWRKWAQQDIPVVVQYNPEWDLPGMSGRAAMQWSIAQWNGVQGSYFRFAEGPDTDAYSDSTCSLISSADGINSVRFSYILPYGTLGSTCALVSGTQSGLPRVVEFDIQLDGYYTEWTDTPTTPAWAYDLRSTMLHELGHALGLDHTNSSGAVMLPTIDLGEQQRTITADDRAGVLALYGSPATPTPTPQTPALIQPRFCRSSPSCTLGAEPLLVGQQARAAFMLSPLPAQQLRGEVRWNGVLAQNVLWPPPPYSPGTFYLADEVLGVPTAPGTFELRIYAGNSYLGAFSASVGTGEKPFRATIPVLARD